MATRRPREALANPTPNTLPTKTHQPTTNNQQPATDLNTRLTNRTNQQQAQTAQLEAAQKVRHLIEQYGIATVRTWLRTGVPPTTIPAHS